VVRRIRGAWILAAFMSGCIPAGAEIGGSSGGSALIAPDMAPDPAYRPRIGDRAILFAVEDGEALGRLPLLKDVTAFDIFVRSANARDIERLSELEQQGWLHWAVPGTRVIVIDMQDRKHTGASFATQVRVVDDATRDQTFWTPSNYLARMIHVESE
jgi:hypothetical protein